MNAVILTFIVVFTIIALGFFLVACIIGNKTYTFPKEDRKVLYKITLELASCDDKTKEVREICRQISIIQHTLQHNFMILERDGKQIPLTKEMEEREEQFQKKARQTALQGKLDHLRKEADEIEKELKKF